MADDTAELIQRILARGPTEEDLARKRSMESENVGQFFKDAWGNLKGIVKTPYDVLEKGIPATFGDPGAGRRARQAASEAAAMGYPVAQSVIPGAAPTGALPAPQAAPVAPPAPAAVAPVARSRLKPAPSAWCRRPRRMPWKAQFLPKLLQSPRLLLLLLHPSPLQEEQ